MLFRSVKSALLSFYHDDHVPVLGPGSYHGRQDDLLTDMRTLDGRDIMVLCDTDARVARTRQWFAHAEVKELSLRGARFWIVMGHDFQFTDYRETVIVPFVAPYYRMPAWLAVWSKPSFFLERYDLLGNGSADPATKVTNGSGRGKDAGRVQTTH